MARLWSRWGGREAAETVAGGASENQISQAMCSKLSTLDFTLKTIGILSQSPTSPLGPPSKKVLNFFKWINEIA